MESSAGEVYSGDSGNPASLKKPSTWVKSQTGLALVLNVDRQTIRKWLKIPGNPGKRKDDRYDVEDWRAWQKVNSFKTGDGNAINPPASSLPASNAPATDSHDSTLDEEGEPDGSMLNDLRAKKLAEEVKRIKEDSARLKLQNEVERGELISLDEMKQVVGDAWSAMIAGLNQMNHRIAQQVVGLDSGAASKVIKAEVRECLRKFNLPNGVKKKRIWKDFSRVLDDLQQKQNPGSGQVSM